MYILKPSVYFLLFFITSNCLSQTDHSKEKHHGMKSSHRITLGLGHTSVSEGEVDGETKWLAMPSWSLNYDYWISDKWAIGLQNDLIVESFKVEEHDKEILERHYPLSVVPVVMFKPANILSIIGGVGEEFASGHSITLTRLGLELGFHIPGNWEVGGALVWDAKWDYYNSWGVSFTFSKLLH
jgi:hypothetical protein